MRLYQVDAFADKLFSGNPAAVCPLPDNSLPDTMMQNIAAENNLSETAFFYPVEDGYAIRWFAPSAEVDLCGHATLAAAHVLWAHEGCTVETIRFFSRSGLLTVTRQAEQYTLDFPEDSIREVERSPELLACFNDVPQQVFRGKFDYLAVFASERMIRNMRIDEASTRNLQTRGLIVTAPGTDVDFVSRFFAPGIGIPEDPVTGSAHTSLVPYWSERLGKKVLTARQLSARGGYLFCEKRGDRTFISGKAKTYLIGEITV